MTRKLADAGYERVPGGKCSHEKWRNADGRQVTVPSKPMRHIANVILKQAGLAKAF